MFDHMLDVQIFRKLLFSVAPALKILVAPCYLLMPIPELRFVRDLLEFEAVLSEKSSEAVAPQPRQAVSKQRALLREEPPPQLLTARVSESQDEVRDTILPRVRRGLRSC